MGDSHRYGIPPYIPTWKSHRNNTNPNSSHPKILIVIDFINPETFQWNRGISIFDPQIAAKILNIHPFPTQQLDKASRIDNNNGILTVKSTYLC